jgi:hypothetical protein
VLTTNKEDQMDSETLKEMRMDDIKVRLKMFTHPIHGTTYDVVITNSDGISVFISNESESYATKLFHTICGSKNIF